MLDLEKLNEIKEALPSGSLKRIQSEAKVSYLTVIKYFKGESQNVRVTEAVLKIYKEHVSLLQQLKEVTPLH